MHILFLTDNFPPEVNAPASRTHEHCREWVRAGHAVTVITGAPNFPKGKIYEGYRNRLQQSEQMDGIRVVRVWTYIAANAGFTTRILDYQSFMASAIVASLFVRKPDMVVGTSPQFFTVCAAYAISRLRRIPFVFELRDLWPESIRAVGAMKDSCLLDCFERLELFLYDRADRIISVTRSFKQNLTGRGVSPDKIEVVTNGVDIQRFHPQARDSELAARLGLSGKFVAGYVGTHGMAHSLHTILDAAGQLRRHPLGNAIQFLFLGDGATKSALRSQAEAQRLDNVTFVDTVPKVEVKRYWSLLDVAIIHLKNVDLFQTVIPSKLFESMAMGIPVLHGVRGESAEIVEKERVGIHFEPENAHDLCEKLLFLAANPNLREELGRNAQRAASRFDRSLLAEQMLKILERLGVGDGTLPQKMKHQESPTVRSIVP
jgi:hypothetical protein